MVGEVHTGDGWSCLVDSASLICMSDQQRSNRQAYDAAFGIVALLGLYQGVVPLLVRLLFDRDQRLSPALWLPAPWWWIACLAVIAATVALLTMIATARQRRHPTKPSEPTTPPTGTSADTTLHANATRSYDTASAVVFLVGIYNGVAPFIVRLVFDRDRLLLALPLRLHAPWWWITSLAVIVATIVLLAAIDQAKQRRQSDLE